MLPRFDVHLAHSHIMDILQEVFLERQIQLVIQLLSCSTAFISSLVWFNYLPLFSVLFYFHSIVCREGNFTMRPVHFLWSIIAIFSLLAGIRWSVFISKSQRILWVIFSRTGSGLYIYHLVERLNFHFCAIPNVSHFPFSHV